MLVSIEPEKLLVGNVGAGFGPEASSSMTAASQEDPDPIALKGKLQKEGAAFQKAGGALSARLLSLGRSITKEHVDAAGGLKILVSLLRLQDSNVAIQTATVIWNLAVDNRSSAEALREAGAIPPLVALLRRCDDSSVQAADALASLAAFSPTNRRAVRDAGGIRPLVALLASGNDEATGSASVALRNLLLGCAPNRVAVREAGGVQPLVALLPEDGRHSSESDVVEGAAGALWQLTADPASLRPVARAGGIQRLLALLGEADSLVAEYAAGALQNLATLRSNCVAICETDGFPNLFALLAVGTASQAATRAAVREDSLSHTSSPPHTRPATSHPFPHCTRAARPPRDALTLCAHTTPLSGCDSPPVSRRRLPRARPRRRRGIRN